jgi:hypothetical protein
MVSHGMTPVNSGFSAQPQTCEKPEKEEVIIKIASMYFMCAKVEDNELNMFTRFTVVEF